MLTLDQSPARGNVISVTGSDPLYSRCGPRRSIITSPGNLLELQGLRPTPDLCPWGEVTQPGYQQGCWWLQLVWQLSPWHPWAGPEAGRAWGSPHALTGPGTGCSSPGACLLRPGSPRLSHSRHAGERWACGAGPPGSLRKTADAAPESKDRLREPRPLALGGGPASWRALIPPAGWLTPLGCWRNWGNPGETPVLNGAPGPQAPQGGAGGVCPSGGRGRCPSSRGGGGMGVGNQGPTVPSYAHRALEPAPS